MIHAELLGRVRHWTRACIIVAFAALASCSDQGSVGPLSPGHARLSLAPRFATVTGAPAVPLTRIQGTLTSPTGEQTVESANFSNGSASLTFDVTVFGDSAQFTLDLVSFDVSDVEAYRAHSIYIIRPGDNNDLTQPVLEYSAPDAKVVALHFDKSNVALDAGAAVQIGVTGTAADNSAISPIRVGWTSRNTAIATVDDAGKVTATQLSGSTYIVARTPANVADSVLVTARGAVAQVVATPTSLSVFRGATANVATEVRDPAGTVVTDRPPTFTTSNASIATVNAQGVVTGVAVGTATITATVGDKSAPVAVTVASPVAGVQLAPDTVKLATVGATQQLTATVVAKPSASVAGLTPIFTTSDATVATVGADGRVTATGFGIATITATIESFTATTSVVVVGPLVLSPATQTVFTSASQQFSITSGGKGPFTWTVNGVANGNAAVGTITTAGLYKAPSQVPSPASFNICATQATPSTSGCTVVTIASPVAGIQLAPATATLATINATQQLTATIIPKPGASVAGLTPTFTTSDPLVATVGADGRVTATGYGIDTVTATIESFAAKMVVSVVGPLVLSPATPTVFTNASQQFSVTSGGKAPFSWTVNGVANGNATVGTITATGLYTAPAQIPSPASFNICATQATPSTSGCTVVTIASPVAGIQLAPTTATIPTIGATQQLTATIIAKPGASVAGLTPTFTTSDATVATVGTDGRVNATGYGVATITATIESFTATSAISVVGPLVLSPATPTVFTSATQQFSITSGGKGPFSWTVNGVANGNATVGTITATGLYTAPAQIPSPASFNICATQATPSTSGCTVVTIASPVAGIQLAPSTVTLATIGATQLLTATIIAKPGGSVAGLTPTFATSNATVATVGTDGRVTAVNYGIATITASISGFSAMTAVSVVAPLTLSPATAEKLPNGTQQFIVTAGGNGPFTWTVNGTVGGSATYGTINGAGFYTAPASVPSPATFAICATQAIPASQGCAQMTINPVPSAGADVIVFNDMNMWQNDDGFKYGGANQAQLVLNLINFTGTGPRVSQRGFMFYRGHGSLCAATDCAPASISQMTDTLKLHGYNILDNSDATLTGPVDPQVKTLLILVPSQAFSVAEINILKQFASEGGRIVFSGENSNYYGSYIDPVENALFTQMGAQLRNTNNAVNCASVQQWLVPPSSLRPHQVTTGLTGVAIPCAAAITVGPNDYALVYDSLGTSIVGAVAKIDLTPLQVAPFAIRANANANANRSIPAPKRTDFTGTGGVTPIKKP